MEPQALVDGAFAPSVAWLVRANRLALLARLLPPTVHDVNNALQIISGGVELLEMAPGDPASVTQAIGSQADRASQLLARLAAFARDRGDADPEPIDLHRLAGDALAMRGRALGRLRIRPIVDGEATPVLTRRHDALQIALNLIMNAEQALAGRPSPRLRVAVTRANGEVRLEVEDNGPGAGPDGIAFDCRPLPDGPNDRLGIGLWVSRALAARLDGSLAYRPGADGGAVFTLTLPASGR